MDGIQDFFADHPNWGKVIVGALSVLVVFAIGTPVTMNVIGDVRAEAVAEHELRLDAEDQLDAEIAENADLIVALDGAQTATRNELTLHKAAYDIFVDLITDAVEDNAIDITAALNWVNDFDDTWADFQEQYELDQDNLYSSMAAWTNYAVANAGDIDGLEGWAETIDDWATENTGSNWDDYPEFTE